MAAEEFLLYPPFPFYSIQSARLRGFKPSVKWFQTGCQIKVHQMKGRTMKSTNTQIIAGFLLEEQKRFFEYLEDCSIDPIEGAVMIEEVISESDGGIPTCVEQLFGFIDE
jgi:hypothetical protein